MERFQFPRGFLWGAATSTHQVEGNSHNDWFQWELKNADRLSKASGGKYPPENYISGRACDHYNRFREDFDIAKQLGHNAHRFSIEWSRIEPEEGKFDEKEIAHYQEVINVLRERGIEPFVTLWHWTLPLWIRDQGGWENKKTIADFARYCEKIITSLHGVKFWITINEPEMYAGQSYFMGIWPPQKKNLLRYIKVSRNLIAAHKKVYEAIHSDILKNVGMSAEVGIAKNNIYFEGWCAPILRWWWNFYFLNRIKHHQDFIGLNYYFHRPQSKTGVYSDMGWQIYPKGIYYLLKDLKKYKKPVYITENGLADATDEKRTKFIVEHIQWIARAMKEGADVRGYLYWSLMDNFEWDKGFWPRFGLVEIDYKNPPAGGERKIRPSALEYKKIIEQNSVEF